MFLPIIITSVWSCPFFYTHGINVKLIKVDESTRNSLLCSLSLTVAASLMSTEQSQYVYEWSPYVSTLHYRILLQDFLFSPSSSPLKGLFWFRISRPFSSPFVFMFSFLSPFECPSFSLSPSWLPSALPIYCAPFILLVPCCLSTVQLSPAKCPPSTHTSFPLTPLLPPSIHHAPTLASPLPSLPPSRDNYYKPCEDQLVFKQLNKQGLGLLTVTIQQQSTKPK